MGQVRQDLRPRRARRGHVLHRGPWWAGAALTLLVGCSGELVLGDYPPSTCDLAEPPAEVRRVPLTIATFWGGDDQEREILQKLLKYVDKNRYVPTPQQMNSRVDAQLTISDAFENQELPDVFQVNGGNDVLRWVQGRDAESTDVCSLNRLRDIYDWDANYFSSALAPLSCRGALYGLPVGIHHLNVLFYNRELFAELQGQAKSRGVQLVEPSELQTPHELIQQLHLIDSLSARTAQGAPVVPLAIGATDEWPLTIVAFENVLLGLGQGAYETLWLGGLENDPDGARRAQLRASLEEMVSVLRALHGLSNFKAGKSWQEALRQVGDGEALMTITGDWGWAQLSPDTLARVSTATFPGTAGHFVYTPDSFAVPRELKKDGFPARSFLHDVVENRSALIDFSNSKHSIPPRKDLDAEALSELASDELRATYREFAACEASPDRCKLLLAVSGLGPAPGTNDCFDDIDALLTLAVADVQPSPTDLAERRCSEPFPTTSGDAAARLLELLLSIGSRHLAADCQ